MSAYAYIRMTDVPAPLLAASVRHIDDVTGAQLVAFPECPFSGQLSETRHGEQVEFPFPRNATLRYSLVDWLVYWGIHFTVVM